MKLIIVAIISALCCSTMAESRGIHTNPGISIWNFEYELLNKNIIYILTKIIYSCNRASWQMCL